MNALVSIDIATLTPATVFAPGGVEAIVAKIEAEVSAEVFTLETEEGRERIKSVAYKVARSKTALDDMGKELVSGIKAQAATIDAERRVIRERLDALKDQVRGPLTAWEVAETERVDGHERAIVWLIECDRFATAPTANMIRAQALDVSALSHRDWQEFKERGDVAVIEAHAKLSALLLATEQAERDAAELAELRRQKAKRDEDDAKAAWQKAENERMAIAAAEAVERERSRAEQQAERDRVNAERAEADKIAAAARAVEQERERVARQKADEDRAAAKREANQKHRNKVHGKISTVLCLNKIPAEISDEVVCMLVAGEIPHVSITY